MLELLAFLLPVAAAWGWYAAKRYYTRQYLLKHARPLTQAYCRGLNYFLNEKTDQAIDVFAHLLESEQGILDTQIALGNLFRRRGEVEKAIEIHARLIDEPGLGEVQKAQARYELGVDYMRAGLFDRAEAIFLDLADTEAHRKSALQRLLQMYQQEKDWPKAMDCLRKLLRFAKPPRGETMAQFLCELAEEAAAAGRYGEVREYLRQALRDDPACVRANLIKARLDMAEGAYAAALPTLKRVEEQNPAYLPEIIQPLGLCYERLGKQSEWLEYLGYLYQRYGLIDAAVRLAERLRDTSGAVAAAGYLLTVLETKPCLEALAPAIEWLSEPAHKEGREELRRLGLVAGHLRAGIPRYRCGACGFSGAELHWRCPSCQVWGAIAPVHEGIL